MTRRFALPVRLAALAALVALGPAGCRTYRPMPLSAEAVDRTLAIPGADPLRVAARDLRHPLLPAVALDLSDGLSPDEAAVLAVLVAPSLRAERDRRGLAQAQVLQAGILPNPELAVQADVPAFGATAGTVTGWSAGLSWDVSSLVGRGSRIDAAKAQGAQVDLEVAWAEWQAAMAARTAVVRLAGLAQQAVLAAGNADRLRQAADRVGQAVAAGRATAAEQATAESAATEAASMRLDLERQRDRQRLDLCRLLGLPPDADVRIQEDAALPERVEVPPAGRLLDGLETRRLDLVALRRGYDSQEAALHAAVLAQFPRIHVGIVPASDTSRVGTAGFGIAIELPLLDRNQGAIAAQTATRQQLFDEYAARLFEARADLAALAQGIGALDAAVAQAGQALPVLERVARTYADALARGQADGPDAQAAFDAWTRKRIEALALRQELAEAEIALELAAGIYRLEPPAPGARTEEAP